MKELNENIYLLPTDDDLILNNQTIMKKRIKNDSSHDCSVDDRKKKIDKELALKINEAYKKGVKDGIEQGFEQAVAKQKINNTGKENRVNEQLKILTNTVGQISSHIGKIKNKTEEEMLTIIFDVIFEFVNHSIEEEELITKLLKRHLSKYFSKFDICIQASTGTINEIRGCVKEHEITGISYKTDEKMPYTSVKLFFENSISEINLLNYLTEYISRIEKIFSSGNANVK